MNLKALRGRLCAGQKTNSNGGASMRGKSWKKLLLVGVVFLFVVASGQVAYSQTKLVQITGATSGGT